jgi:ribonuclease HI
VVFDPHAVKIHIDGNCWKNPGGSGGLGIRVDYGSDIDRECEVVEYRGYFETNNQRMELRACIFAHVWIEENVDELGAPRFLILTDSSYVYGGYGWVLGWCQNDYRNSAGRPMKNDELWKDLMTLRRKLGRCVRIEVKLIPRRSDEGAKAVDRLAKAAGKMPTHVDWGFPKGKIGRSKNNVKSAARLYPAAGQEIIIRPYQSGTARRGLERYKFQVYDEVRKDFFEKFEAYVSASIGGDLHRQNVYRVRMNDVPRFPQIVEILEKLKEGDIVVSTVAVSP